MSAAVCRRVRVTGRVQGVFYRAATRAEARRLGLTGWARNQPDGSVEVLVCGDPHAVQALVDWLWQGPPQAAVQGVEVEAVAVAPPADFTTG